MLKSLRWVFVWGCASALMAPCLAKIKSPGDKRHQFFLTSAYTKEDLSIKEEDFSNAYQRIIKQGIIVYRNGQTYSVLVPLERIYKKGTSEYKSGGQEAVKDLVGFLDFYDAEYMSFSGLVFRSEEVKSEEGKEKSTTGLKTDISAGKRVSKKITSDLMRKKIILKPELVKLKQTSRMVSDMRKLNKNFAGIAVSITEEIDKNQALMDGVAIAVNDQIMGMSNKIDVASQIIQEVIDGREDLGAYDNGAILIEFKKF